MTEMRYELAIERIENIKGENTVSEKYRDYFRTLADFALLVDKLKEKIESTEVKISVKVGKEGKLFGSVSTKQITDAIQAKLGEKIDKRKIALDGPINSLGTYEIPIQLHKDVIAKIKLFIVEE